MKGFIINYEVYFQEREADYYLVLGVLENGKNFIWQINQPFYLGFLKEAIDKKYYEKKISNRFKNFRGTPLTCYFFSSKKNLLALEKEHPHLDIQEKDVNPINQFLMAEGIKTQVEFLSKPEIKNDIYFFDNPKFQKADFSFANFPSLRVVSIDIEVGVEDNVLYSIAFYNSDYKKVFMVGHPFAPKGSEFGLEFFSSEKELLIGFIEAIKGIDPHLIMGWNVVGFDFSFLAKKLEEHNIPFAIGVNGLLATKFIGQKSRQAIVKIPGRAFLEGMEVVKLFYPNLKSYSLANVSEVLLNQTKTIEKKGWEKIKEIDFLYQNKPEEFALYNFKDTELVFKIIEKIQGIDLMLERSRISGVPLERLKTPNEVLERLYLPLLHKKYYAAYSPLKKKINFSHHQDIPYQAGFHRSVWKINFAYLLEDVITAYHLDPLGMIRATLENQPIQTTPKGFSFHQKEHILPYLIVKLGEILKQAKKAKQEATLKAVSILFKNIISSLANTHSRFFLPGLYDCLNNNALFIIEKIISQLKPYNYEVLYYNQSTMVLQSNIYSKLEDQEKVKNLLQDELAKALPQKKLAEVSEIFFYNNIFIPEQTKKREVLTLELLAQNNEGEITENITKRNDLSILNQIKKAIILKIFQQEKIEIFLKEFKKDLLARKWDEALIYRERLYKKIDELENKNTPVVEAAKKMTGQLEKYYKLGITKVDIAYVYTTKGVFPVLENASTQDFLLEHKLDYFHYLEKEIYPYLKSYFASSSIAPFLNLLKVNDFQLDFFN